MNIGIRTSLRGKKSILKNSNRSPIQEKKVSYDDRVDEDAKERANEFHRKGYMARKEGRFEEAIKFYTQAIEVYPHHYRVKFLFFLFF